MIPFKCRRCWQKGKEATTVQTTPWPVPQDSEGNAQKKFVNRHLTEWSEGKLRLNCININFNIALLFVVSCFYRRRHLPTVLWAVRENNIKQHHQPTHTANDTTTGEGRKAESEAFECISDLYNEWNFGKKFLLTLSLLQFVRRVSWEKYSFREIKIRFRLRIKWDFLISAWWILLHILIS